MGRLSARWLVMSAVAQALAGCCDINDLFCDGVGAEESSFIEPFPFELDAPPSILPGEVPEWRPLGPASTISVVVSDDRGLNGLTATFEQEAQYTLDPLTTFETEILVTGADLGEGLGDATLTVTDSNFQSASAVIHNLLVDLTPPTAELGATIVRRGGEGPNGSLAIWVADAWVLGTVSLRMGGITLVHEFPEGRPATVGVDWDQSLVFFSGADLPEGSGNATLEVTDAAGNVETVVFPLLVDGQAPTLAITAPLANAVLNGTFVVTLTASDPEDEPVWIELDVGGAFAGSAAGPTATLDLDSSAFAAGDTTLGAVAGDRAGNRSARVVVPVTIQ